MNYSQIRKFDVTNGPNVRTTLFVSGCTNNCEGCFNSDLKDFNSGHKWTKEIEDDFIKYAQNPNVYGVSILGGEPLEQTRDSDLVNLLKRIKEETNKEIWLWSGFVYEDIINDPKKKEIIDLVDVLVDGRFVLDKRNISLKYRGSENQRVIDIKKSDENNIVEVVF